MSLEKTLLELWPGCSEMDLQVGLIEGDESIITEVGSQLLERKGFTQVGAQMQAGQDLRWAKGQVFLEKHPKVRKLPWSKGK